MSEALETLTNIGLAFLGLIAVISFGLLLVLFAAGLFDMLRDFQAERRGRRFMKGKGDTP